MTQTIEIPIEEKKTFAWIEGIRDCMDIKAQMPHTRLINVMDREEELISVIAHEIAHVTQRHLMRAVESQQRTTLPATAALIAIWTQIITRHVSAQRQVVG